MGSGFFKYWLAQQARGFWLSVGPPNGFGGRVVFFFNGPPNGPGGFGLVLVRPTGLGGGSFFFFNGPPNGPGRGFGFFFNGRIFFQWSAQRAWGDSFLSTGSLNGSGGVSFFK